MFDHDFVVIGSGFGGSVSALLRLTEKGYRVAVLEKGKRSASDDFAKTNWNVWKYLWMPTPRLPRHPADHAPAGRARLPRRGRGRRQPGLREHPALAARTGSSRTRAGRARRTGRRKLAPHYETARFMLGVTEAAKTFVADDLLRQVVQEETGRGDTFTRHTVGVYFGEPNVTVPDPFFGGEGPERTGCTFCGECMTGCKVGAKNTLDKNYLWLAEKRGARSTPRPR